MNNAQAIALAVSVLCGWAIPSLVALVTKANLPAPAKQALTFALSALAGAVSQTVFDGHRWTDYLIAVGVAWVNAIAAHYAGTANLLDRRTARFGIGPKTAA